jgi:hypothetical protein
VAKTVRVTSAQVNAAKLKVKRSAITGKYVSPGVKAVADAKRESSRSGSGTHARSAVTGQYVTPQPAARHPDSTVTEQ